MQLIDGVPANRNIQLLAHQIWLGGRTENITIFDESSWAPGIETEQYSGGLNGQPAAHMRQQEPAFTEGPLNIN